MTHGIRILLLADSHLGFDLPLQPRVSRRRRGHDFFANFAAALEPALRGDVDIVVHGGDVFDRPTVAPSVVFQAFDLFRRVAERGVPVFVVPGNHERSRMPHGRLATHPGVHVFASPGTRVLDVRGTRIALAGFPYERNAVRTLFPELLRQTRWDQVAAGVRILCMHHCVEGATVGPGNYTFSTADDVVKLRDIPAGFTAVLSGHIHRHQVLTTDPRGCSIKAPVLYPGSVERTSVAEIGEPKGYVILDVADGRAPSWEFRQLPARPMLRRDIAIAGMSESSLASALDAIVADAPGDAVLSVRLAGDPTPDQWRALSAARLRAVVPETMNVEISASREFDRDARTRRHAARSAPTAQLSLYE